MTNSKKTELTRYVPTAEIHVVRVECAIFESMHCMRSISAFSTRKFISSANGRVALSSNVRPSVDNHRTGRVYISNAAAMSPSQKNRNWPNFELCDGWRASRFIM